ncbi:MAG: homocysteine S-methyltransferase family protein, partial [Aristaeellaceae bacterium]
MAFDQEQIVLLDGAMGTMLHRSGLKPGELPELVALTRPELLEDIHRQYIGAGSHVVYANTFGANRLKLAGTGHSVDEVVHAAVAAAKRAAEGTDCLVGL